MKAALLMLSLISTGAVMVAKAEPPRAFIDGTGPGWRPPGADDSSPHASHP